MSGGRVPVVVAAAVAAGLALSGCGLADSGANLVNGKEQFVQKCAACHTLARAKSQGVVGPNLDEAWQQADKDAHQENKFRAEANRCYRVYVASDEGVKDVVVVLRDSAGDVIVESPAPAVPQDGAVCFTTADEVSLLVGVGSGKGSWAAQVWSD